MYYLQSRYYDPAVSRFINVDDFSLLYSEDIKSNNMFAYCSNAPTIYADYFGNVPFILLPAIVVGLIAGVSGWTYSIADSNRKYNEKHDVNGYVFDQHKINMKYAYETVAEAGCGIVAAHNALVMLGRGKRLSEIVYYCDKNNGAAGSVWSVPYWTVADCIKKYGNVSTKTTLYPRSFDSKIKNSTHKAGVIAFPWHYVFVKWDKGKQKFLTYNFWANETSYNQYNSIDAVLKGYDPFCVITF